MDENKAIECSEEGCSLKVLRNGLCNRHHRKWWRYGSPSAGRETANNAGLDFLRKLAGCTEATQCIIWPFAKNYRGYGRLTMDGRYIGAHLAICEITHGKKPSSVHLATHACGNASCVNPNHIRWGTPKSNSADAAIHGTQVRGEKQGSAKLTADAVRAIRRDGRLLREIAADYNVSIGHVGHLKSGRAWRHL